MTTMDTLLTQLLADPMGHSRAHHAAGGRVIGFIGADVPVELMLAADAFPFNLTGSADLPTPRANSYLEPSFAPLERSIAEQWISGDLNFVSTIILSRARDSSQRLYYYICELQRRGLCPGPPALLFDIAKIERTTSVDYTTGATRRLADLLGSDLSKLPGAVEIRNRRRTLLGELQQLRCGSAAPSGSYIQRLLQISDQCVAAQFDTALADWIATAGAATSAPRIVLAGSAPPDDRLHTAVERAGGVVVAEYGDHALDRLGKPVAASTDVLQAISSHYHSLRYGPRMFGDRASDLVGTARSAAAQAVVLWLLEEEEALIWDLPAQLKALADAAIPSLVLTRRRWDANDGTLDQIESFVRAQGARPCAL